MDEDRLKHSIAVARKMMDMSTEIMQIMHT